MTRKEQSEAYLQAHQIKINPNLPDLKPDTAIKSPDEILRRALAALLISQIAIDTANNNNAPVSARFFHTYVKRFGLEDELTPDEKRFIAMEDPRTPEVPQQDAVQMVWRIEMCMPLFWACGLVGELSYPDTEADCIPLIRMIDSCKDFDALREKVQMHSDAEILDHADLILRMDWACVDALIKKEPISGGLSHDIVMERHKGFNWLVSAYGAEDWDHVQPHT